MIWVPEVTLLTHQITFNVLTAKQSRAKQSPYHAWLIKAFFQQDGVPCKKKTSQIVSVGFKYQKKKRVRITDSLPFKAYVHPFQWYFTKSDFLSGIQNFLPLKFLDPRSSSRRGMSTAEVTRPGLQAWRLWRSTRKTARISGSMFSTRILEKVVWGCLGVHELPYAHAVLNFLIMQKGATYRRSTAIC